ncbi:MAG: DUF642 domain-containing protein [Candidatus Eisenbacteria bacterium]
MNPNRLAFLAIATALVMTSPAFASLLVNGSFEPSGPAPSYLQLSGGDSSIPGWVTTDSGVEWYDPVANGGSPAPEGRYVVDLANYVYSAGGIQQTMATIPGQAYAVTFWLSTQQTGGRDGTAIVDVSAGPTTAQYAIVNHTAVSQWTLRSFEFTANSASTTLWFRCLQDANLHFAELDAVGMEPATPSAPDTWGRLKARYR